MNCLDKLKELSKYNLGGECMYTSMYGDYVYTSCVEDILTEVQKYIDKLEEDKEKLYDHLSDHMGTEYIEEILK